MDASENVNTEARIYLAPCDLAINEQSLKKS